MTDNQKFLGGLILGAAAGAALALFFNSEKGKEVLADAKGSADKMGVDIKSKLASIEAEMNALIEKGKVLINELGQPNETIG